MKPKVTLTESYKKDIEFVLEQAQIEEDIEKKQTLIFDAFQFFNNALVEEENQDEKICINLRDTIDKLEKVIEEYDNWNKKSLYEMKLVLLQTYNEIYEDEQKIDKYIEELTSDSFISEGFEEFDFRVQVFLSVYVSKLLVTKKKSVEKGIILSEKCLKLSEDVKEEDKLDGDLQMIHFTIAQLYKNQNMHAKAFQHTVSILDLMHKDSYSGMINMLPDTTREQLFNQVIFLVQYCYQYQQYELAADLAEALSSHLNDHFHKQATDILSDQIILLKNMNKYYKKLLTLNTQINKIDSQLEKELEDMFVKYFFKYLNYQDEFNKCSFTKAQIIYGKPLFENNLHKFSSETKHEILKIAYKFDQLSP